MKIKLYHECKSSATKFESVNIGFLLVFDDYNTACVRIIRIIYSWSKREDLDSELPPTQGHSEGGGGVGET